MIPGGKPRQNTLMKAGQDPDNTGPGKYAQTQHILLAVLHSDYVIGSALHGSFRKARRLHHSTDSPHGPTQWGLHMGTVASFNCLTTWTHIKKTVGYQDGHHPTKRLWESSVRFSDPPKDLIDQQKKE